MEKIKLSNLKCRNININIDEYIEFRKQVKNNMQNPEWLGDFEKEELLQMLDNNAKIWIYFLEEEPICSMMLIPSTQKDLDKFEINLDYKEVVDYGPMFVNPKYIGNGLQYQMLKEIDKYAITKKYKYACGTIHPENTYSINNFLKDKFVKHGEKKLKRGQRNIYIKKLQN